jgi:hypothetical protein
MSQSISRPTSAGDALPAEWLGWIAENLLGGVPTDTLVTTLTGAGVDPAVASDAVAAAASHPYLQGATTVLGRARHAESGGTRAAKYAWWLEVMRRSARQASTWGQVPRIHRPPTATLLDDYYAANRPCVIEGAMDDWPALTRWTADYLRSAFGDATVQVEASADPDTGSTDRRYEDMRFGDFVDLVEEGTRADGYYMTANNAETNAQAFAGLWDDIVWPEYLQPSDHPLGNGWLWYGPKGSFTPLHHDLTNNLMAQFRGRKLVKLVAPFESAHMYNDQHRYSPVDLDAPDLERFPEVADVTIFETTIGPGEMLFVPAGWWHTVRALDVSITITFPNFIWDTDHYSHYTTFDAID